MPAHKILVINPNTTSAMTDALKPLINGLKYENTTFTFYTAPSGVPSINNEDDAAVSVNGCSPSLLPYLPTHDAFLVCCYSKHPLVDHLRESLATVGLHHKPVTGIFEASVSSALQSTGMHERFGIVSTGSQWQGILNDAVYAYLGSASSSRFTDTTTTGLDADQLHKAPKEELETRMKDATKSLLAVGARAICLGCAGMAGMDEIVRKACVEEFGETEGKKIVIVDGVIAGAIWLDGMLRATRQ
ncbi:Protein dcg1 [Oleoguttula sp. CCFEE 5521]